MEFEFEIAKCEQCGEDPAVRQHKGEFWCQSCIDAEFGAWRDHVCGQCGRVTNARKTDDVYCYNTVFHNRKGGIRMEVKK